MTRKEEIRQAAESFDIKIISNPWILFEKGAEWADAHPKPITYEAIENIARELISEEWKEEQERLWNMIERNLFVKYRNVFVNKTCEWLKDYAHMFVSETTGDLNENDLIKAFRKAMKEE